MNPRLLVPAIAIFLAGIFPAYADTNPVTVSGRITAIDLERMMFDGPALITVDTAAGAQRIIALPSMGIMLCPAYQRITPVGALAIGDSISVRGEASEDDYIVPCTDKRHLLRAQTSVEDSEIGYKFIYRKGPAGYVLLEDQESQDPDFLHGHTLFERVAYEEFQQSAGPREAPPSMHLRIYKNTDKLHASVWALRRTRESSLKLALGEPEEAVVAGANAVKYIADGLYPMDTRIVAHGGYIFVLMGPSPAADTGIHRDFEKLVASLTFIRTASQQ